jgi:hypothetical protein
MRPDRGARREWQASPAGTPPQDPDRRNDSADQPQGAERAIRLAFLLLKRKAKAVTTTVQALIGRKDASAEDETIKQTLVKARRIFADVSAFLELEIDRLFTLDLEREDADRTKRIVALIRDNQKALLMVLEIETKLGRGSDAGAMQQFLDLEAARDEIASRLARLAA